MISASGLKVYTKKGSKSARRSSGMEIRIFSSINFIFMHISSFSRTKSFTTSQVATSISIILPLGIEIGAHTSVEVDFETEKSFFSLAGFDSYLPLSSSKGLQRAAELKC